MAKKRLFFPNIPLLYAQDVFQVCKPHRRDLKNPFTLSINYCSIIFRRLSHLVTSHHHVFVSFSFFERSPESDLGLCLSSVFITRIAFSLFLPCQFHNFNLKAVLQLSGHLAAPETTWWEDDFVRTIHALMWCRYFPSRNPVRCQYLCS